MNQLWDGLLGGTVRSSSAVVALGSGEAIRLLKPYGGYSPLNASKLSPAALGRYSHSMVPGGLDVMSSTARFTWRISLIMREAIRSSRS